MDDTKKASRVEWLCAAMIDFIPVVLFSYLEIFLGKHLCLSETISALAILLAVYMLLKDYLFDGRSWGKRFVDIRVVWPEDSDKACLIYRNLPLSLMILLWGWRDLEQIIHIPYYMLRFGFVLYIWADLICVALKGKTLGDCFAHTSLEVCGDPNYVLHKNATKRIACFIIVLIMSLYEAGYISPSNLLLTGKPSEDYSLVFYVNSLYYIFLFSCSLFVSYKIIREYLQGKGIDVVVIIMIVILLFVPSVIKLLSLLWLMIPNKILLISFILMHIVSVMVPVVYLCEKIVNRIELRWVIYVLALAGTICSNISNIFIFFRF